MEIKYVNITEERFIDLIEKENKLRQALELHPNLFEGVKLTSTVKRYRNALQKLVLDIEEVCRSDSFATIFKIAHLHGADYKGKSFADALKDAKSVLGRKKT